MLVSSSLPAIAFAYVGPGVGLSGIGTILALLAAVILGIFGFLWYPIKRLLKKRQPDPNEAQTFPEEDKEE